MNIPLITVFIVAITIAVSPVNAGTPTPTPTPHYGRTVISSISGDQITIESGKAKKTFKINDRTEFFRLGKKVSQSDLGAGMRVVVTPAFGDNVTAGRIEAFETPTSK